ncbi:MAG: DUF1330 domain-containing protein [Thermodesulfobacteriota bacterium]
MTTYSIITVTVKDQELFQKYVDGHGDSLTKFGGRFLAASSDFEIIEGTCPGQIVVIHQWPDRASFHNWYTSEDYRPWKEIRFSAAETNVVLMDGLPE